MGLKKSACLLVVVLVIGFAVNLTAAEKIGIDITNNYVETGDIKFRVTLYDDSNNQIEGVLNYYIRDYYSDLIQEGETSSGEEVIFTLPENVDPRPWEISATYNSERVSEKFNVGERRKIEVRLEGDQLVIRNVGNSEYEGHILIYIGQEDQTANVFLARGQTKKIRLTAPDGVYEVKVDVGEEEELVFQGVSLTGNVVSLERVVEGDFWDRYPMVGLFLAAIAILFIIVLTLKLLRKFFGNDKKTVSGKKSVKRKNRQNLQ